MKLLARTHSFPQWRKIALPTGRFLLTFLLSAGQTLTAIRRGRWPWCAPQGPDGRG